MTAPAKAKVPTVKLEPGTDLVGTVKFVSYYPEKEKDGETYGAQWGLQGTWNGEDGRVYIDLRRLTNDISVFLKEEGRWADGSPKYKWIGVGVFRIHPYVKDKRHYVSVGPEQGPISHTEPTSSTMAPPLEPEEVQAKAEAEAKLVRKRWADLFHVYSACVQIARDVWPEDTPPEVLHAAAATLLIAADKRALPPPPKRESDQ